MAERAPQLPQLGVERVKEIVVVSSVCNNCHMQVWVMLYSLYESVHLEWIMIHTLFGKMNVEIWNWQGQYVYVLGLTIYVCVVTSMENVSTETVDVQWQ